MSDTPVLRRWLSALGAAAVLAAVVGLLVLRGPGDGPSLSAAEDDKKAAEKKGQKRQYVPLWGGGLQRNLVNTWETGIARDWDVEAKTNILWSAVLGSKAYGGPILAGGKIFVGTNNQRPRDPKVKGDKGIMMCFDQKSGKFLWQIVHDKLAGGRVNDWPEEGICSSPVVDGEKIYYVSNRCEVVCASTDGKVEWKLDMIKDFGVFPHNLATCSPLMLKDTLFVITSNGVDEGHRRIPAPDAPSFLAINKKDGKVIWKDNSPGRNIMHGQWSNPVYAEANGRAQIIFPGGDGYIRSFNPKNGELYWKFDCNPKGSKYLLGPRGTKNDFVCTPVVHDDKLYIGVGQDPEHKKSVGHMWCIDITKEPKTKDKDVSPYSDPKVEIPEKFDPKDPRNKGSALVWHYGGPKKGTEDDDRRYKFGRTMSTAAVHDGLCYVADFDGFFYCFDAKTGELHWKDNLEQDTWSSPYWVDGHVYIGNEQGDMRIYKHGKKKDLVKTVQMDCKIRATPVAVGGVLYVMTENPCLLHAIKK
jgi:outer membrane protein assembly factor BamB